MLKGDGERLSATPDLFEQVASRLEQSGIPVAFLRELFTSKRGVRPIEEYPYCRLNATLLGIRDSLYIIENFFATSDVYEEYKNMSIYALSALIFIYVGFEGDWGTYATSPLAQNVVVDTDAEDGKTVVDTVVAKMRLLMEEQISAYLEFRNKYPELAQSDIFSTYHCEYLFDLWRADFGISETR